MAVYVCSDLHGCYDLYQVINNMIKPDDTVIFIGDAGDRGPEPWKTIEAIYENPQWTYLKGNHEDMLVKALRNPNNYDLLEYNGGAETYKQCINTGKAEEWADKLEKLPTILCGRLPWINGDPISYQINHSGAVKGDENDFLWNRTQFAIRPDNCIVIHGHTPTEILLTEYWWDLDRNVHPKNYDESMGCIVYCGGRKIDIDLGSVWTGYASLINLDTMVEYVVNNKGEPIRIYDLEVYYDESNNTDVRSPRIRKNYLDE